MRRSAISFCIPSHALGRLIAKHPLSADRNLTACSAEEGFIVMLRCTICPEPEVGLLWGQAKDTKISIRHTHCCVGAKYLT